MGPAISEYNYRIGPDIVVILKDHTVVPFCNYKDGLDARDLSQMSYMI